MGAGGFASTGNPATFYQVYGAAVSNVSGSTLNSNVGAPGPNSKTCLSCHDGTLSLAAVSFGTGQPASFTDYGTKRLDATNLYLSGAGAIGATGLNGTDLTKEHPIGVVYNTSLSTGPSTPGLEDTLTQASGYAKVGSTNYKVYGALGSQTVECGSCHDPHNTATGQMPFLKGDKTTICSDCHRYK